MTGCYTRTYKKQIEDSNKTFSLQLSLPCFLHIYNLAVNKLCCEGFIISHQHAKNKDTKIYMISSLFAYDLIIQNHGWFHMGTRMVVARGFFLRDPMSEYISSETFWSEHPSSETFLSLFPFGQRSFLSEYSTKLNHMSANREEGDGNL